MRIVDLKLNRTGYVMLKEAKGSWMVKWHNCNISRINPVEKVSANRFDRFIIQYGRNSPLRFG